MAKNIETIENATLVSVEQLDDRNIYEWDWRCKFAGCKGTLYIGESQHKNHGKRFIILNPVIGALVHNAGSVVVIINSALLLNWSRKQ